MDALNPTPLTLQNPWEIIGVIALALLVPPYALLHGFLLYCLWVYLLPREQARWYAILTTLGLVVVAAVGAAIWLTNINTDFYPMIAVVTAITVIAGVSLTLAFANQQADTPKKRWLVLAAALISLIVPTGVAAVWVGWWAVFLMVFGFIGFRRVYFRHFAADDPTPPNRWFADRMALETLVVGSIVAVVLFFVESFLVNTALRIVPYELLNLAQLAGFVVALGLGMVLIGRYVEFRLRGIAQAKHGDTASPAIPVPIKGNLRTAILGWLIGTAVASGATFFGQMAAQGWFTSLTK